MPVPTTPPPPPRPDSTTLAQRLARRLLALAGWTVDIAWPPSAHGVVIVYPHTSNWDFVVGYLAKVATAFPARWIGKHTIFRWPFGALFRRMGGIPVDRSDAAGLIPGLVGEMQRAEHLWIALAPEGTRRRLDHVKTGFHRLAVAAEVPVGLAWIDWGRREIALRRYVMMTGDEERDLAVVREAYAGVVGKRRGQEGEIRFRGRG